MVRTALVALTLLAMAAPGHADDADKAARAKFEGTFRIVGVEREGLKVTEAMLKDAAPSTVRVTFKGGEMTASTGGKEQGATFELDPARQPAHITITAQKDGRVDRGIYRFEGELLILCVLPDSAKMEDRPTEFKATGKVVILTLRKEPAK